MEDSIIIRLGLDNEKAIKSITEFIKQTRKGAETIEELVAVEQKLLNVSKQVTDRSSEGFQILVKAIADVRNETQQLNKDIKASQRQQLNTKQQQQSYEDLQAAIKATDNTINGLIERRKLLTAAFNNAKIDGGQFEKLRKELAATNAELKTQKDSVKAASNALGGINESAKFAKGSYGELRQQIAAAKKDLQAAAVGSKEFYSAQLRLNKVLQEEINIRQKQPSLFKERIKDAINESNAVKQLRLNMMKLRQAELDLKAAGKQNTAQYRQLQREIAKTSKNISRLNGLTKTLSSSFKIIGAGIVASLSINGISDTINLIQRGVTESIRTFADFEQGLANVRAVSGATVQQLKALEENALELGGATQFTASQIVSLQTAYSKLGFDPTEITNVTAATVDLATATGESLEEAAQVAGATLRGYQIDVADTARITDVMAQAFNSSGLSLETFKESQKLVSSIAASTNISLEAVTGTLGVLADRSISGSIAGTGLRRILTDLTTEGSKVSKALGFTVDSTESYIKAIQQLNTVVNDPATAQDLFGRNAQSAALAIAAAGEEIAGTEKTIDGVTKSYGGLIERLNQAQGAAKAAADIQRDTLNAQFNIFISAIEALSINLVKLVEGPLKNFVTGATSIVNALNRWIAVPISAKIEEERINLNTLVGTLQSTVEGTEERTKAIGVLQAQYPDFLANINEEAIRSGQVTSRLKELNEQYAIKALLEKENEKVAAAQDEVTKAFERRFSALREGNRLLAEQGIIVDENSNIYDELLKRITDLRAAQGSVNSQGIATNENAKEANALSRALNELRTSEEAFSSSVDSANSIIEDQKDLLLEFGGQTGQAADAIAKLKVEIERLNTEKENTLSININADTSEIDQKISNKLDEIADIEGKKTANTVADNITDTAANTARNAIAAINEKINAAIEKTDFDLASSLTEDFARFGSEGEKALKAANERITAARLKLVNDLRDIDLLILDNQKLNLDAQLLAFEQSEKQKIDALNAASSSAAGALVNNSSSSSSSSTAASNPFFDIEDKRVSAQIAAIEKKLAILRAAGSEEAKLIQQLENEKLSIELKAAKEREQALADIESERLERTIRFATAQIQTLSTENNKAIAALAIEQKQQKAAFNDNEKKLLSDFAAIQAERAELLRSQGKNEEAISLELAQARTIYNTEANKRVLALDAKFQTERQTQQRHFLLESGNMEQALLKAVFDTSSAQLDSDLLDRQLSLQEELRNGIISNEEYTEQLKAIRAESLNDYVSQLEKQTAATTAAIEEEIKLLTSVVTEEGAVLEKKRILSDAELIELERLNTEKLNLENALKEAKIRIAEEAAAAAQASNEKIISDFIETAQFIGTIISSVQELNNSITENRLNRVDALIADRTEKVNELEAKYSEATEANKLTLESQIESERVAIENLENEKEAIRRKAFENNKRLAIAEALINGALAATRALAEGGVVGSIPLIALAAAQTAAQIAIISAQQFKQGGALLEILRDSAPNTTTAKIIQLGGATQYAKGGMTADGMRVIEGGHLPNDGMITGRRHSNNAAQSGVKFVNRQGRLLEAEAGEYTTITKDEKGRNIRMIYNRKVAKNPTLLKMAKLTGGAYNPAKIAVGSFINRLTGGNAFAGGAEVTKMQGVSQRLQFKRPLSHIVQHQEKYSKGGAIAEVIANNLNASNSTAVVNAIEKLQERFSKDIRELADSNKAELKGVEEKINKLSSLDFTKKMNANNDFIRTQNNKIS